MNALAKSPEHRLGRVGRISRLGGEPGPGLVSLELETATVLPLDEGAKEPPERGHALHERGLTGAAAVDDVSLLSDLQVALVDLQQALEAGFGAQKVRHRANKTDTISAGNLPGENVKHMNPD